MLIAVVDPVPDLDRFQPLHEGVILRSDFARRRGLTVGSPFTFEISGEENPIHTVITGIGGMNDRSMSREPDVTISRHFIQNPSFGEVQYFINVSEEQEQHLRAFLETQRGIFGQSTAEKVEMDAFLVRDYYFLLQLFMIYFIISAMAVLIACSLSSYVDRLHEFCVYEAFGITRARLVKIILLENVILSIVVIICSVPIASVILSIVTRMVLNWGVALNTWLSVFSVTGTLALLLGISLLVLKTVPFKSIEHVLRQDS